MTAISAIEVVRFLHGCRLDLSSEKRLQEGIERALEDRDVVFVREKRLSPKDIPDFLLEGGIVIECKMRNKARKVAVYKQLERYAAHPEVTSIILAANLSMGLPPEINGKPVYKASLSAGWM